MVSLSVAMSTSLRDSSEATRTVSHRGRADILVPLYPHNMLQLKCDLFCGKFLFGSLTAIRASLFAIRHLRSKWYLGNLSHILRHILTKVYRQILNRTEDKGKDFQSCMRPAMLYGSKTWCFRKNKLAVFRRTERSVVRAICGVKLMDRKNTKELMGMLGLQDTLVKLAKANGVRWYGHVLGGMTLTHWEGRWTSK